MSTGEASGRDAFDFLSNISFGGPESGSRSSKKSKTSQSRSAVSHKAGELTKSARGGPGEGGEGHLKNSRPSAHPTDDSPSKSSLNASHKASETVPTPVKIRSSHSGSTHHKETKESKHELASKSSQQSALDFLSGISLGSPLPPQDTSHRVSKDIERPPSLHHSYKSGSSSKLDFSPSKSIHGSHQPSSIGSDSILEDLASPPLQEEELGVHEATNLLFGHSSHIEESFKPVNTTIISSKAFTSSSRTVVKSMMSGQRTMFAFPSPSTPAASGTSRSKHHQGHHYQHPDSPASPTKMNQYGAMVITSILCQTDDKSAASPSQAASNTITSRGLDNSAIGVSSESEASEDEVDTSTRSKPRPGMRLLPFKKKTASKSYQRFLKPTLKNAEMNAKVTASLPVFRSPAMHLMSSNMYHTDDSSGLSSISPTATPRSQKLRKGSEDSPRSPTRPLTGSASSLPKSGPLNMTTLHSSGSGEFGKPNSKTELEFAAGSGSGKKPKSSRSKHRTTEMESPDEEEEGKDGKRNRSASTGDSLTPFAAGSLQSFLPEASEAWSTTHGPLSPHGMATHSISGQMALPPSLLSQNTQNAQNTHNSQTNSAAAASLGLQAQSTQTPQNSVFQALVPYERCLKSYDPQFLDHDIEASKSLIKSFLPCYTSSIMPLKPIKLIRQEENEAFNNKHTWLTTDLKLSKLRSVKKKLELVAISLSLDIACTAFSYVYFEKLILRNLVSNHNARVYGAVCLLLGVKFYGVKMPSFSYLIKELGAKLKLTPREILGHEFFVFRKLKFSLFVQEDEVYPHFWKLRASPYSLDKEFQLQTKERKKHLRKQQNQPQNQSAPSSANPPPPPPGGLK